MIERDPVACDFTRMIAASKRRLPISAALAKASSFVTGFVQPVSLRPFAGSPGRAGTVRVEHRDVGDFRR